MLATAQLTRRFGDIVAVDGVSMTVADGQLTGFIGGNGAGKTTTMRMIMGVLASHAGTVTWEGVPVTTAQRRRFGYMPEERGLYPKQPVIDQLVYLGRLKGMSGAAARTMSAGYLERFGLGARAKDRVEKLSLGNQQRVQIIASLLGDPELLVLDEPFSGLDPLAVDSMVEMLREQLARGVPVLFSSHQLDLVDRLCDRLVIMSRGRVVAQGTAAQLRTAGPVRYHLALAGGAVATDAGGAVPVDGGGGTMAIDGGGGAMAIDGGGGAAGDASWVGGIRGGAAGDVSWVGGIRGVTAVEVAGSRADFEVTEPGAEQVVLAEALRRGSVASFGRVIPPLSEIYRKVTA